MIYYCDKKLKKRLHVLETDIITVKKNIDLLSLAQRMHFLPDVFQITAIAFVSVINYHINGFASDLRHPVCALDVVVIVAGIGHSDTSSNPGLITFHMALIPLGKVWIQLFSLQLWVNSRAD